jgi:hypothetical protein
LSALGAKPMAETFSEVILAMNVKMVIKHTHKHPYFRKNSNSVFAQPEIQLVINHVVIGIGYF